MSVKRIHDRYTEDSSEEILSSSPLYPQLDPAKIAATINNKLYIKNSRLKLEQMKILENKNKKSKVSSIVKKVRFSMNES